MALSHVRAMEVADAVKGLCDDAKALLKRAHEVLETNSDLAIDWGAAETPAYLQEDEAGNLAGRRFARAAVSNAIGTMSQLRNLFTNQTVSEGDHLGNINILADAES